MRRAELALVAVAALLALSTLVAPLSTPYWWDEGAVYAPGAKWLAEHGFDARPGVFPDDLSRGHTPLYYLVLAGLYRLFGAGPVPGHALALAFGCAAVVATYALGRELWGPAAGALSAALLATAPLFLTMASDAFPEMPLLALTAATFYAFARGNLPATAALGTVLVLLKEPGVACPVAIAGSLVLESVRSKKRLREERGRIALTLVPAAVVAAYFLYQKAATGWFITPYHDGLYHEEHSIVGQLWRVAKSIYLVDGKFVAVAAALVLVAARWRLPPDVDPDKTAQRRRLLVAFALHGFFNVAFFAKSFYLERYTLQAHVGIAVVLGGALAGSASLPARAPGLVAAVVAIALALSRRAAGDDMVSGETSFRYLHGVHAQAALFHRLDAAGGAPVVLTDWPLTDALRQPFLGWVSRPFDARNINESLPWSEATDGRPVDPSVRPHVDRVIAVPSLGSYRRLVREATAMGFHRIDRAEEGPAAIELWGP